MLGAIKTSAPAVSSMVFKFCARYEGRLIKIFLPANGLEVRSFSCSLQTPPITITAGDEKFAASSVSSAKTETPTRCFAVPPFSITAQGVFLPSPAEIKPFLILSAFPSPIKNT